MAGERLLRRISVLATAIGLVLFGRPALAGCVLGPAASLPITMVGSQPLLRTKVNGADALLLADSGAFFSMMTPGGAAQLHLSVGPAPDGFGLAEGVGGETDLSVGVAKTFTLGGTTFRNVEFIVGGSEVGGGAMGVLGQNVLGQADVEYDLARGAIRILRPKGCDQSVLAYWAAGQPYGELHIRTPDARSPHTIGSVTVNGVRLRAMFDTGASTSVLDLDAAERLGIRTNGKGVVPGGLSGGIGRRPVPTWIAPVVSFEIGGEEIKNTRLRIGKVGLGDADMLVGADFFLSHHVYVANSQAKLYFTYGGGPVFDLKTSPQADEPAADGKAIAKTQASSDTQADAEVLARLGSGFAARGDYARALADLDRAVALKPDDPRLLYQRAQTRAEAGQGGLAALDLDASLKLSPDDPEARLARADLRMREDGPTPGAGARDAALTDLDAVDRLAAKSSDLRLRLAELYAAADRFQAAIAQYGLWIGSHREDSRLSVALNGRCWARALGGVDLDKALVDCNAALRILPGAARFLDSRGLARLRRGEFALAISDYDAALKAEPKMAWSLYGRGVAWIRRGDKARGEADLAASAAVAPKLPERAKALGIAP